MSKANKNTGPLVIGGAPRIDLLPPAFKAQKDTKRKIRSLISLAILVAVVCVAGYAFATGLALQSQAALADEQAKTPLLIREQGEYIEAQTAANQLAVAQNAKLVGSSTEILWKPYLEALYAKMPEGVTVLTYTIATQSSVEAPVLPTQTFERASAGTIIFAASLSNVAQANDLVINLRSLPGVVNASVLSVTLDETTSVYTANVRLSIDASLFERRFFPDYVPGTALLPPVETTEDEG